MGLVMHVDGWRVEETVADVDGTGERTWHEVVPPWGGQQFVTTSGLRALLRRAGLDVGDLKPVPPDRLSEFDDGCE